MSEIEISTQAGATLATTAATDALPIDASLTSAKITPISVIQRLFCFPMMMAALLVAGVFVARRDFDVDPDFWWHIKVGQDILNTRQWPTSDSYSFTVAGQPWVAAEWLGDVLFAVVHRFEGFRGLEVLLILLGASIIVSLYAFSTLRCGNSKAGFVTSAVLLVLATANFNLRPQMLGYLFLILTLIVLERFRQGKHRGLWFLPLLFLIWVNTHGSFVIGITVIGAYLLAGLAEFSVGNLEARRWSDAERMRIEIVLLLCVLALTVTPYGTQLALYPFHVAFSLPMGAANVVEWQPMPFDLFGGKLFLVLLLGFLVAQMTCRFRWRFEEVALFLFGTMMACFHARFLLIFVPLFAPLLATVSARWVPPYTRSADRYTLNAVLMIATVAGMIFYFPGRAELEASIAQRLPVRAVAYLQAHSVPRPIFNTYNFGGYLVWAGEKVFVDGRADPFERGGSLSDYFYITNLRPGALVVLRSYGIQSCLLQRGEPLATMLAASPDWQEVYADNLSVLFVRRKSDTSIPATHQQAGPDRTD